MSQLTEEQVDILLYCVSGVSPATKVSDLGCTFKGEARKAVSVQYLVRLKRNSSRLSMLSEELEVLKQSIEVEKNA